MNIEKVNMSQEESQRLLAMLQSKGFSPESINEILNGDYSSFENMSDLEVSFGGIKKHDEVLGKLSDGYSIEELESQGISSQKIQDFNSMLKSNNLTIDSAKAIYEYSIDSTMISKVQRGADRGQIQGKILTDLSKSLQDRGIPELEIGKIQEFVKGLDYQTPLHNNYDISNTTMSQLGIPNNCQVSVRAAIREMNNYSHIDDTVKALNDGLAGTRLPSSMVLHRAVKSSFLEKGLKDGESLESLVGRTVSNSGHTSTSPLYESSFASLDEYDAVFEIYAPKGSQGAYIAPLSSYDKVEQEVLLSPNDMFITDVQTGVIDQNGRNKTILKALMLSKERECYKDLGQNQDIKAQTPEIEQPLEQEQPQNQNTSNLPMKQNRFSKFFNQIRSKFARQKVERPEVDSYSEHQQRKSNESAPKEKKTWELEPGEKVRIQKETVEIAKQHREKQEQQVQQPTLEASQEQPQADSQVMQGQVPQQPIMDVGGIEL